MRFLLPLFLFLCVAASPVHIVYVDQKTEAKLGDFPISRAHYGQAVEVLNRTQKPQLIVLKLFLDVPKKEDAELTKVLQNHKNVYTQAETTAEKAPDCPLRSLGKNTLKLPDHPGAFCPVGVFGKAFAGIGFVNGKTNEKDEIDGLYLVNSVKGEIYPSLPLLLAKAYKREAITLESLKFAADGSIPLPPVPKVFPWKTYSFLDLIEGKLPPETMKDAIVLIFYSGKKASPLPVAHGRTANQAELTALLVDSIL